VGLNPSHSKTRYRLSAPFHHLQPYSVGYCIVYKHVYSVNSSPTKAPLESREQGTGLLTSEFSNQWNALTVYIVEEHIKRRGENWQVATSTKKLKLLALQTDCCCSGFSQRTNLYTLYLYLFIPQIYIAPLQGYYSETLPIPARLKGPVFNIDRPTY